MDTRWLPAAQRELIAALLSHATGTAAAEAAELRAAGVSEARIASLYPFDIRAYRPGVRRAFSNATALTPQAVKIRDVLERGFALSQIEWTITLWLPLTTSVRWDAEVLSARASAHARASRRGPSDPALLNPRVQLLTNMYLLPGLIHELARYLFEGEVWDDAAHEKLTEQAPRLRAAVSALCAAARG